jgi:hypothetical protein
MWSHLNNMITLLSFFTNNGALALGLSPTIKIRKVSDSSIVINEDSMIEIGDGFYKYEFNNDETESYTIVCDGGDPLTSAERYTFSSTEIVPILNDVSKILKIEAGRWKIMNNKMYFYDEDGTTILYTFNLKDKYGNPTEQSVFERIRI